MSATKGKGAAQAAPTFPFDLDQDLIAIGKRAAAGLTAGDLAKELGITRAKARSLLNRAQWYAEAVDTLRKEPTNIRALRTVGVLPRLTGWLPATDYGIRTLHDLAAQEWSRAEIDAASCNVGRVTLDRLEQVMAAFGLALHPDRPEPKQHELTEEARTRNAEWGSEAAKWRDPEFLAGQCQNCADAFSAALAILKDAPIRCDDAYLDSVATAIQHCIPAVNALIAATKALNEAERQESIRRHELAESIRHRREWNAWIVKIEREHNRPIGNVYHFPTAAVRDGAA